MELKPIASTRTAVDLAEELRARIQCGELAVGSRLPPQRVMATQLSVGRQAVSEALALLEAEGYIVTRRGAHGGSFVREPVAPEAIWMELLRGSMPEHEDTLDFRCGVEAQIARLACRRRTDEEIVGMQAAIDALTGTTRAAFREADGQFHALLARSARNSRLEDALRRARADVFVPNDNLPYVAQVEVSRRQHQEILDAVISRDEDAAMRAVTQHIEQTRTHLRMLLADERP